MIVVSAYFKLVAAGPMFFVSAWLLMLFAGATHEDVGIAPFGYLTSMVVTIALWLTLAPAIGAAAKAAPGQASKKNEGVRGNAAQQSLPADARA